MRGPSFALALVATAVLAPNAFMPTPFAPAAAIAEPLSAGSDNAGIFRIIQLKGSAVKWGSPTMGSGAMVSYAFATAPVAFSEARNCRGIEPMDALLARSGVARAVYEAEAAIAFAAWSAVANIKFRQVRDTEAADILIGAQAKPVGRAFTNVSYSRAAVSGVRQLDRSLICLNPTQMWKVGFDGDLDVYDLRYTLKHEIGHAIGLDHPATTDQVMSYRYEERFDKLQPGDIHGAVALYGSRQQLVAQTPGLQPVGLSGMAAEEAFGDQQFRALSPVQD